MHTKMCREWIDAALQGNAGARGQAGKSIVFEQALEEGTPKLLENSTETSPKRRSP
jgi:hypothetical protein